MDILRRGGHPSAGEILLISQVCSGDWAMEKRWEKLFESILRILDGRVQEDIGIFEEG